MRIHIPLCIIMDSEFIWMNEWMNVCIMHLVCTHTVHKILYVSNSILINKHPLTNIGPALWFKYFLVLLMVHSLSKTEWKTLRSSTTLSCVPCSFWFLNLDISSLGIVFHDFIFCCRKLWVFYCSFFEFCWGWRCLSSVNHGGTDRVIGPVWRDWVKQQQKTIGAECARSPVHERAGRTGWGFQESIA